MDFKADKTTQMMMPIADHAIIANKLTLMWL
jgi:hypothetical protein